MKQEGTILFLHRWCQSLVISFLVVLFPCWGTRLSAQSPSDFVVDLRATVSTTVPCIRLAWTQRLQPHIVAQRIHRRVKGAGAWTQLATLGLTATSYADSTALPGVEYEYWMERDLNAVPSSVMPGTAAGYLSAGVNVPAKDERGKLLLVIDNTLDAPLALEIDALETDLISDGWLVQRIVVPRTASVTTVKASITAAYAADPARVRMVYLFGHVPVPYSGNNAPDGHSQHWGAWPADGFYGDMDGVWGDSVVNNAAASVSRNDNLPRDGKFDPSTFPSALELAVGRVDFSGMTLAPSASVTEVNLMRRYLKKAHDYRYKLGAYANIPRRALIRDGLEQWMTSLTGWHWAYSALGQPPAVPIDIVPSGQWFSTNYAGGRSYLIGYSSGYSGYDTMSGLGTSADFGTKASKVVFLGLFGSYFGDWDSPNNLMRATLAGNAAGSSLALGCIWAGAPNYFMHNTGMGETIGYSVRASQNGPIPGGTSLTPGGPAWGPYQPFGGVHTGLMGDPALRLHGVEPPRNLAVSISAGRVTLNWTASTESDLIGYHIYRSTSSDGPFTRMTPSPLFAPTYTDATATPGQNYTYMVKTLVLEKVPGGSYLNLSQGASATLFAVGGTGTSTQTPPALGAYKLAWQIGTDSPFSAPGYTQYAEFSLENNLNDARPGKVTRLPGDPRYVASNNPKADDDFYTAGNYPVGFNQLSAALTVPFNEPDIAWERSLTASDRTNRVHFILNPSTTGANSKLRLTFDFCYGGSWLWAPLNRLGVGFGQHDVTVIFRNASGQATVLFANRIESARRVSIEFSPKSVAATAGANTIEFIRTGVQQPLTSYWLVFDYLSLETAVPLAPVAGSSVSLAGVMTFSGVNELGAVAAAVPPESIPVSHGFTSVDGKQYLTLTYKRPELIPGGIEYSVEAGGDLSLWSTSGVIPVDSQADGELRIVTVRDSVPISESSARFLRVRVVNRESDSGEPNPWIPYGLAF